MLRFPHRFVFSGVACALVLGLGLVAWAAAAHSSEAQPGTMHNCPPAAKWSIAVWDGESGTAASDALAACGADAVAAAYSLDSQTGAWSRWFAAKPDVSNLPPLNDMQGVLALGGTAAAAGGDTLAAAQGSGQLHNCPPAGDWSIAVWEGASGTAASDALATCGADAAAAAYSLDPQTGGWSRWFAAKPDVSNLPPLGDMQGVLALGSATGPTTPALTPSATACPSPTPLVLEMRIVGDDTCLNQTTAALGVLQSEAEVHHDVVIKNIGVIECVEFGSGMFAWEDPPRYAVGEATRDAGTIWYAGTIVHDACHSKQYRDYLLDSPCGPVPSDVFTGKEAEAQCLDAQYDALTKIGASQETLDYLKTIIDSEYWDVDYADRWW